MLSLLLCLHSEYTLLHHLHHRQSPLGAESQFILCYSVKVLAIGGELYKTAVQQDVSCSLDSSGAIVRNSHHSPMARSATAKQRNRIARLARRREFEFSRGTLLPVVIGQSFPTGGLILAYPLADQGSNPAPFGSLQSHSVLKYEHDRS